jgi:hypothetical protein
LHTLIAKNLALLKERLILQDRGHPAQTSRPPPTGRFRRGVNFPGGTLVLEPCPSHNIPAAPGARSGDESLIGIHVPVYRTQTGCGGCRDPYPGNLPVRRATGAHGSLGPVKRIWGRNRSRPAAQRVARKAESFRLPDHLFACRTLFDRGTKAGKRVARIRHHRHWHSATLLFSSGTLAGLCRCAVLPEPEEPARTGLKLHLTQQGTKVTCRPVAELDSIRTPAEERRPAL